MTKPSGPQRVDGVELLHRGRKSFLIDEREQALSLNNTALALWELCDGVTTVDEMVNAIDSFFNADRDVIRHDVEATLRELADLGFITWSGSEDRRTKSS